MKFSFKNIFRSEKRAWEDQTWIQDWLNANEYGITSFAGIRINENNSIKYSAVLACVRIISETIASLPLFVYKRLKEGKEKAPDHALYNILHSQPNPEMSSFIYREMMAIHLLLWGNSYSQIIETPGGDIKELFPLLPWNMTVMRENNSLKLIYKYKLPDNSEIIIPNRNILHIIGMSFDGLVGKSLIALAREAIGLGMAMEEFGAKFYGQGTQFGGFIEHPKSLGEKAYENLKASMKEKYQGIQNAHKIMILEEGMKFSKNIIPPNDAQFIESRQFQLEEIARIFNVPPHLIKDLSRSTYDNIEQQGIEYVVYTIRPWLVRIEQTMFTRLFSDAEKKLYFIEFLVDGLYRGDIQSRYNAYNIGRQGGWLSADDIRELENMNPLPNGQGKIYWMPLNMTDAKELTEPQPTMIPPKSLPLGQPEEQPEEKPEEKPTQKSRNIEIRGARLKSRLASSYKGLFEETTLRILKFERSNILKKAEIIFGKRNINILNFMEYLDKFYKDEYNEISKRSRPVINTYGMVISDAVSDEIGTVIKKENLDRFMDSYSEAFNANYINSSKKRLNEIAQQAITDENDPLTAIENKFNEWEESRPGVVATRETIKIAGAVSYFTYKDAGIQEMVWINTGSPSCPYCQELDGQVMGIELPFKNESDSMQAGEGEPLTFSSNIFHPPLHGGCQCMLVPG